MKRTGYNDSSLVHGWRANPVVPIPFLCRFCVIRDDKNQIFEMFLDCIAPLGEHRPIWNDEHCWPVACGIISIEGHLRDVEQGSHCLAEPCPVDEPPSMCHYGV